jgi:hypothetical protein
MLWGSETKRWKLVVVISDMAECMERENDGEQLKNAEHFEFWVGIGLNVYGFVQVKWEM